MTTLLNGQKTSKNDPIIHFIGTADELNSHLGLVKALLEGGSDADSAARLFIEEIQKNLMKLMSHVSDPSDVKYVFSEKEPACLEKEINRINALLPKQTQFVLPGRDVIEAQIHIARTVARRTERLFAALNEELPLSHDAGVYLNKLSGYLFALSQLSRN
ncbi:cob(I)yrinic acid a,c-diamide adenosyltransferase [Treponema sp. R6D11]